MFASIANSIAFLFMPIAIAFLFSWLHIGCCIDDYQAVCNTLILLIGSSVMSIVINWFIGSYNFLPEFSYYFILGSLTSIATVSLHNKYIKND